MKSIGMIMIILFTSSLGLTAVKHKKEKLEHIDLLIYLGTRVLMLLKSTMPETEELLRILKNDQRLEAFDFSLKNTRLYLKNGDCAKVYGFFDSIGKYDVDSQTCLAEEFTQYFKLLKEQYQAEYNSHYKLYIVFGVFSGVAICILLA